MLKKNVPVDELRVLLIGNQIDHTVSYTRELGCRDITKSGFKMNSGDYVVFEVLDDLGTECPLSHDNTIFPMPWTSAYKNGIIKEVSITTDLKHPEYFDNASHTVILIELLNGTFIPLPFLHNNENKIEVRCHVTSDPELILH